MTQITIDLPDWAEERNIYIMAGMELVAYKQPGEALQFKVERCNNCGLCCRTFPLDYAGYPPAENGVCIFLIEDGKDKTRCSLGIRRPFNCCMAGGAGLPGCAEEFEGR